MNSDRPASAMPCFSGAYVLFAFFAVTYAIASRLSNFGAVCSSPLRFLWRGIPRRARFKASMSDLDHVLSPVPPRLPPYQETSSKRTVQPGKSLSIGRIRAARAIAICADAIQIGFPYIFGEGFFSPLDDALDVAMWLTLTALLGWHHAFIPTFLVEILPLGDFAPTWTIAAFLATRNVKPGI